MDIIKNNPYRIIGILVGTSTKDEHTKSKKLKMYIEAEQEVPEDFSFPILGSFERNLKTVDDAVSKLNLNSDRVNASIFWFYNGSHIDEPMFDAMRTSREKAKEVLDAWKKLVSTEEVTKKNASAFQNLSTLRLTNVFIKIGQPHVKNLESGIALKLKFLESDYVNEFIKLSADETYKFSKEDIQINFLKQVYSEIEKHDLSLINWYMDYLYSISFVAKEKYLNDFVNIPIERIKEQIDSIKTRRKTHQEKAYELGKTLSDVANKFLPSFQNILGKGNIQFTSISDKLSEEVLQCGIDYFKKFRDTKTDPSANAMDLFKKAKKIAVGSVAIQRCQENTENLQEWIDDKPEREKHNVVSADLKALIEIFDEFEKKAETIGNARILITLSKPLLNNIKNILGASDEMYLKLSTRVASQAQSYIIEEVNNAQDNFEYKIATDRYGTLNIIKTALRTGWEVTNLIGTLDMEYDFKTGRFSQNKQALRKLCNQLDVSTPSYGSSSSGSPSNPSYSSTPSSSSTPRPSYTPPKSKSDGINWGWWVIGSIIFVIAIETCEAGKNNDKDYGSNDSIAVDTTAVAVNTAAVLADTSAYVMDTTAAILPEENYSSPYIGNQLQNGASPLDDCFGTGLYDGNATLTIKNGGNHDAIVCLYSTTQDRTIRNEYVQKNSSFKMSNISQGYYKIRVFYGNDWNPNLENSCGSNGNFETDVDFAEFDDTNFFEDSSRGYTNATVTLYTVANGNAASSKIDPSTFFNK